MNTFTFKLTDEERKLVEVAQDISVQIMLTLEEPATKFANCVVASVKMLGNEAVTKEELQGLLDTIGGYYCATDLYCKKYGEASPGQMQRAEELLQFAIKLQDTVRPRWTLEVIKGGKG